MDRTCSSQFTWKVESFLGLALTNSGVLALACLFAQPGFGQQAGDQIPSGGQVQVPVMRTQQAVQEGVAKAPQAPFAPLNAEDQAFLDQVLSVWEKRTAQVTRYTCEFQRWQYNPNRFWDKNNPKASYYSEAKGELKYMHPDKGYFVVNELKVITQANPPKYEQDPARPFGEFWICDGAWVYIRDRNEKKEKQFELPPDQRGESIENSPLPFLFGVKAEKLKQRYWLRPIKSDQSTVWIEAWPKRPDDAGNYSRVQVVLDRKDILPSAIIVFMPNWAADKDHKEIYQFSNRQEPKENWVLENVFQKQFIPTKLPGDWEIEKNPWLPQEQRVAQPPANAVPR